MLLLGLIATTPLAAQTKYRVESDELEIFNKEGRAVFTGNVRVWNDTGEILANRLEVFYEEGGDTVRLMKAFGDVEITRQNMYAESQYAEYDVQSDTAILQEDAYVRRSKNEFWADWMWLNMREETVRLKDNVRGTLVGAGESRPP